MPKAIAWSCLFPSYTCYNVTLPRPYCLPTCGGVVCFLVFVFFVWFFGRGMRPKCQTSSSTTAVPPALSLLKGFPPGDLVFLPFPGVFPTSWPREKSNQSETGYLQPVNRHFTKNQLINRNFHNRLTDNLTFQPHRFPPYKWFQAPSRSLSDNCPTWRTWISPTISWAVSL